MALEKITEAQMDAAGVCAAPDILNGTPAQNKAVFDRMVRGLVAPAYNACVDVVNELQNVESGVVAAEEERVAAEAARKEAEAVREDKETGYVRKAYESTLIASYEANTTKYGRLEFTRNGKTFTLSAGSYNDLHGEGNNPGAPEKAHSLEVGRQYKIEVYRPDERSMDTKKVVYDGGEIEVYGVEISGRVVYEKDTWTFVVRNKENTRAEITITAIDSNVFPPPEKSANNAADSETNAKWYAERAEYAYEYTLEKKQQAEEYAIQAIGASNLAKNHADRAEAARESIVVDEQKLAETVKSAEANALAAGSAASAAADHAATTARIAASVEETKNSAMGYANEAANSAQESSQNAQRAEDAANRAEPAANRAEAAANRAEAVGTPMSAVDPVGTGSFSLNRKPDTTVGFYSFAEGQFTTASGSSTHAEGYYTAARGFASHAEGERTEVIGVAAHAEGLETIASEDYQHVQGKYNLPPNAAAHVVGNGTSGDSRSNAHTLDWDGNAWFAGDVYVGSTSGTNKDEGSKRLARVDEIPDTFVAKYGITTFAEISEACMAGKSVLAVNARGETYALAEMTFGVEAGFVGVKPNKELYWILVDSNDNWVTRVCGELAEKNEVESATRGMVKYTLQTLTEPEKAQARENIGAADDNVYELIETITVTEAMSIQRSQEPDGTPYKFKGLWVFFCSNASEQAALNLYIYNSNKTAHAAATMGSIEAGNTTTRYAYGRLESIYGLWRDAWFTWGDNIGASSYFGHSYRVMINMNKFDYIGSILTSAAVSAGTTVEIWGVRA